MVDDVMDLLWHKLVQDRHGDSSIGKSCQEGHCPVGTVSTAKGNLVTFYYARILEHDVQFLYFACYIVKLQGSSLVVGKSIHVPMVDDALLDKCIKAWYLHMLVF